jgi:hypothetical protein
MLHDEGRVCLPLQCLYGRLDSTLEPLDLPAARLRLELPAIDTSIGVQEFKVILGRVISCELITLLLHNSSCFLMMPHLHCSRVEGMPA